MGALCVYEYNLTLKLHNKLDQHQFTYSRSEFSKLQLDQVGIFITSRCSGFNNIFSHFILKLFFTWTPYFWASLTKTNFFGKLINYIT